MFFLFVFFHVTLSGSILKCSKRTRMVIQVIIVFCHSSVTSMFEEQKNALWIVRKHDVEEDVA